MAFAVVQRRKHGKRFIFRIRKGEFKDVFQKKSGLVYKPSSQKAVCDFSEGFAEPVRIDLRDLASRSVPRSCTFDRLMLVLPSLTAGAVRASLEQGTQGVRRKIVKQACRLLVVQVCCHRIL
jgi:hypothetical protein